MFLVNQQRLGIWLTVLSTSVKIIFVLLYLLSVEPSVVKRVCIIRLKSCKTIRAMQIYNWCKKACGSREITSRCSCCWQSDWASLVFTLCFMLPPNNITYHSMLFLVGLQIISFYCDSKMKSSSKGPTVQWRIQRGAPGLVPPPRKSGKNCVFDI